MRGRGLDCRVLAATFLLLALPPVQSRCRAQSGEDQRCLQCHGQPRIATDTDEDLRVRVVVPPGQTMPPRTDKKGLFVTRQQFAAGVHAQVSCVACHTEASTLPHPVRMSKMGCGACHSAAAAEYQRSSHAEAAARGKAGAARCQDCHGSHDVRRKADSASRTYALNVIKVCGDCHQKHTPMGQLTAPGQQDSSGVSGAERRAGEGSAMTPRHDGRKWIEAYLDSVHGQAVVRSGLIMAATCADCHGSHDVRPSRDEGSRVHRSKIPQTCGRCHVGIDKVFETSIHAEAARRQATQPAGKVAEMRQPPVCSDCHSAHAITRPETKEFTRDIVGECGTCHEDLYRTYRESYHGQIHQLGSSRGARCSSCHGTHNIRSPSDPLSMVSMANRANTCGACHEQIKSMSTASQANFVAYRPHADHRDRHKDPVLFYVWLYFAILISVTFTFWGLHSVAWFVRGTINRVRTGPAPRHHAANKAIRRFTAWHRWTHALVMTSFMGLTLTGLPLKFSDRPWAMALMTLFGGPHAAGIWHRCFAVMVLIYLIMHAVHLVQSARALRAADQHWTQTLLQRVFGPHSMIPTRRDWNEFVQMVRWFLGRGAKPKFDRWTYWEKFDYWADLVGTFIIGGSGLLLWFPAFFAAFLSGYWFNVATLIHGYEALLAVGFIFTIHFFNAHLRWEKFPVDDVIFTGQVSEEEFREERPAQYERLVREGRLDELRVSPAPLRLRMLATIVAVISLTIGSLIVILIAWASLRGSR